MPNNTRPYARKIKAENKWWFYPVDGMRFRVNTWEEVQRLSSPKKNGTTVTDTTVNYDGHFIGIVRFSSCNDGCHWDAESVGGRGHKHFVTEQSANEWLVTEWRRLQAIPDPAPSPFVDTSTGAWQSLNGSTPDKMLRSDAIHKVAGDVLGNGEYYNHTKTEPWKVFPTSEGVPRETTPDGREMPPAWAANPARDWPKPAVDNEYSPGIPVEAMPGVYRVQFGETYIQVNWDKKQINSVVYPPVKVKKSQLWNGLWIGFLLGMVITAAFFAVKL